MLRNKFSILIFISPVIFCENEIEGSGHVESPESEETDDWYLGSILGIEYCHAGIIPDWSFGCIFVLLSITLLIIAAGKVLFKNRRTVHCSSNIEKKTKPLKSQLVSC